jgi:F420-dependent oxidoreductase-like protein
MRVGLQIPNFTYPGGPSELGAKLKDIVQTVDDGGFYSLWVMDHFFQIRGVGTPEMDMLEGYTTLGYFAALTKKVKLGTMVTGVVYRYPGILVKTVTTLDVLSGGRAYCGIGAAWNEDESRGLGIPFPPVKERFERLEEALQIALQMWEGNTAPINGKHHQLAGPINSPQALSKPHPPILIGGMGEKKTLRLVAKYADACNFFWRMGTETVASKLEILKRHCEEVGRSYDQIEKTALSSVGPGDVPVQQIVEECRQAAGLGITHMIFNFATIHEMKQLQTFVREIVPAVATL